MTSKKYSADAFRHTFSLSFMSALPVALVNFLIIFACTSGSLLSDMVGREKGSVTTLWNYSLSNESLLILLLDLSLIVGGMAIGLLIYKYMLGKASSNVFFSVPQTRGQMFLAKYLAGMCLTAAATVLPILICGLLNVAYFGGSAGLWRAACYIALRLFATMIFAFTVTVLVCCTVGSVVESVAYSAVFMVLPIAFKSTVESLACTMLYGSPYGNALLGSSNIRYEFGPGCGNGVAASNIALTLGSFEKYLLPCIYSDIAQVSVAVRGDTPYRPVFRYVLIFLAASAVLACVAALLYKKRKAEKAGFLGANQLMTNLAVFGVSIFAASFVSSMIGGMHYEPDMALENYLIFVIVTVPVFLVVELFILRSFKQLLKKLWMLGVQLGVIGLTVLVFASGLFGYSSRIPAAADIASVSVTTATGDIIARPIGGSTNFHFYDDSYADSALLYTINGYRGTVNPLFSGITDSKGIESVRKVHEMLIACKGEKLTKQSRYAAEGERLLPVNIKISYKLKNGKEIDRQYFAASDKVIGTLAEITHDDIYKEYVASLLDGSIDVFDSADNLINDYYFSSRGISIASPDFTNVTDVKDYSDPEQRRVLLGAVAEDVRSGSLPLDLSSDEKLLGYIIFRMSADAEEYEYIEEKPTSDVILLDGEFTAIPVYENMTNTVAVLEESSLTDAFESADEPVSMKICRFNAENCTDPIFVQDNSMPVFMGMTTLKQDPADESDSGIKLLADAKTVTDKAEMANYLEATRLNYPLIYDGSYVCFEYANGILLYGYVPDRVLDKQS